MLVPNDYLWISVASLLYLNNQYVYTIVTTIVHATTFHQQHEVSRKLLQQQQQQRVHHVLQHNAAHGRSTPKQVERSSKTNQRTQSSESCHRGKRNLDLLRV